LSTQIDDQEFVALTAASRDLHGHMSVLPVAVLILREGTSVVGASEALRGLGGRLDRPRIIEALKRLEAIGAMRELPRLGPRNSPRAFERLPDSPYWAFAAAFAEDRVTVAD
jgi:hypothetical protein